MKVGIAVAGFVLTQAQDGDGDIRHRNVNDDNSMGMAQTYVALFLLTFTFGKLFGKIVNGYEPQLPATIEALHNLNALLSQSSDLGDEQDRRLRSKIKSAVDFITNYELTRELINRLRAISPGIYNELDTLKDKRGRPTDVYIRLVVWSEANKGHYAASFFSPAAVDADANVSSYGDYSVSVNIWRMDNALILLCHELGHVRYIVPNLAEYSAFYERHYSSPYFDLSFVGHHHKDLSGKSAKTFERRFLNDRSAWLKTGHRVPKSLHALAVQTKKNTKNTDVTLLYPELVRSVASKKNGGMKEPSR